MRLNYVITHDIATHRPPYSHVHKNTVRIGEASPQHNAGTGPSYVIMATKTGPHEVSTILPMA
jgi:hypothetical protein